jgi:preprotein translocase subunit SecF
MRSINTSLIALLPVAGLLVAGVVILGSGTLKDLSLVMLIGMLIGAYSSVFLAVPVAVDLKLRDPLIKAHTARVLAKRKAEGLVVDADGDPIGRVPGVSPPSKKQRAGRAGGAPSAAAASGGVATATSPAAVQPLATSTLTPGAAPKPGAKPVRPLGGSKGGSSGGGGGSAGGKGRPTGKRGR